MVRAPRDSWERIGEMSGEYFFYGDGTFELELPEGDTTLEVVKGFEYQPVKARDFDPGREASGSRSPGWIWARTWPHRGGIRAMPIFMPTRADIRPPHPKT